MSEVVIIDAVRTPIGALGGMLASVRPDDLAAITIQALLERNHLDPETVEEVYLGCTNQAGEDCRNIARMAALLAGMPVRTAGVTVNRLCASGLTAVNMAARTIRSGEGDVFIAGGVESMSRAPYSLPKSSVGYAFGNLTAWDTALGWRYPNPRIQEMYGTDPMGETAEKVAEKMGITRLRQDEFAFQSHARAISAQDQGVFEPEIISVAINDRKGGKSIFRQDERPRRDTTMEALARLNPAFRPNGSVTAGNSSGMNDGAASLLLMSRNRSEKLGLKPMARIVTSAACGVEPALMGLGPIAATRKALARAGITIRDVQLFEVNEAFAAQALAVIAELDLPMDSTNVHGGAIALGHPLGCSGARILTTLVHEMQRMAPQVGRPFRGLATLCVGVGQGETTIVEWAGD